MRHTVPGDFEAGQNYLDFTTAEECAAAVRALYADPARRYAIMERNQAYYRGFVRPDALVWNSLKKALKPAQTAPAPNMPYFPGQPAL